MARKARELQWSKDRKPIVSDKLGTPSPQEGGSGDMQLRRSSTGSKLWAKLGGKWLSNILYAPNDNITFETSRNINLKANGGVTLDAGANLTIVPDGDCIIDRDTTLTATGTAKGLHIDYDHTGISASGQAVTGIGLDIDMNCETVTHVGTVEQTGIDIDMLAEVDGVQKNTGIDIVCGVSDIGTGIKIDVTGGTKSTGIYIDNKNGGQDFLNVSSADDADYFQISTIAAGATTLSTVDTTVGATAHLTLDADGDIYLDAATGVFRFYDAGDTNDSFKLTVVGGTGATTLETVSAAADGHLSIVADGDITLNSKSGVFIAEQNGTEFSAANSAYAGMILGFTNIHPGTLDRWTFSTSWESITSGGTTVFEPKITFVAPPSQNVMITVQLGSGCSGMSGTVYLGLASDTSATTLNSLYENVVLDVDETDSVNPRYSWVVSNSHSGTTLTAGTSYDYFIMAKTAAGTARVNFGGAASGIQIWATALPATIYDGT